VLIAIQNQREWRAFCAVVLEQPALADDRRFHDNPARVAHRAQLGAIIDACFAGLQMADLIARLDAAKVAFGAVNSVLDFARHPHLRRVTVDSPSGPIALPAPPVIRPGRDRALGPIPAIGEHSARIRAEFAAA
jgi:crotonobetainyl-CoA:carnitine CoA-transferase CaiB-like acyl-CoA transferase